MADYGNSHESIKSSLVKAVRGNDIKKVRTLLSENRGFYDKYVWDEAKQRGVLIMKMIAEYMADYVPAAEKDVKIEMAAFAYS
jgi:hypothetical protein